MISSSRSTVSICYTFCALRSTSSKLYYLTHHRSPNDTHKWRSQYNCYLQWLWLIGDSGTAPVTCNITGGCSATCPFWVISKSELFIFNIILIITKIFVSFKFIKICKYAFCLLLTLKGTGQIHSTWFRPRGFSYLLYHFKGKCISNLTFVEYSIIFNTNITPKSQGTMLPNGRIISPAKDS